MKFLEFLENFREYDKALVESIASGYRVCFEAGYVETPIDIRDLYSNEIGEKRLNAIYSMAMGMGLEDMLGYAEQLGFSKRYSEMNVFGRFVYDLYRVRKESEEKW